MKYHEKGGRERRREATELSKPKIITMDVIWDEE